MHVQADEQDKEWASKCKAVKEKGESESTFMKLWKYNDPKWYFPVGIVGTLLTGIVFPLFSV
jgi:hypothetical protein